MQTGLLLSLTGIDGSGKTTLAKMLHRRLVNMGIDAIEFENYQRESPYWSYVIPLLDKLKVEGLFNEEIERLLHFIELGTIVNSGLHQLLRMHEVLITDRFSIDKLLYSELKLGYLSPILKLAYGTYEFIPDVTIFLKIPLEVALRRIESRGGSFDWKEEPDQLELAVKLYDQYISDTAIPNAYVVDATLSTEEIVDYVIVIVLEKLETQKRSKS